MDLAAAERQRLAEQLDGLVREGLAHLWSVTLHPYDDGNGRLARALTDRALAQIARPETQAKRTDPLMARALGLSARIQQQRQDYYQELERCQRGDLELTRWLQWFVEQVAAAALSNQAVVAAVQAKAWRDLSELVELQALTPIGAGRSRAYRLGFPFELDQKDQPWVLGCPPRLGAEAP